MKRGYIKLWRKIWSHKFFLEKRKFSRFEALLDMFMQANGKDKEIIFDGKPLLIKRGQFLTSQRQLAARWDWSKTKTREFLYSLQNHDHSIEIISDRKKSIITILNYDIYNPLHRDEKTTENGKEKTTERPQKDHRLVPTNNVKGKINKVNYIERIIDHWNSKQIKNLEERETKVKNKTITKINSRLEDYSSAEIIEAINNYHEILESDEHFFSYKWQLWEFFDRGLDKFLARNNPYEKYLKSKKDRDQTSVGSQRLFSKEDEKYLPMIDKEYEENLHAYIEKEGITNKEDVDPFKVPTLTDFRIKKLEEIRRKIRNEKIRI